MHKATLLYLAIMAGSSTVSAAQAASDASDSVETLQKQLAAQKAINEQLRNRLRILEQQLVSKGVAGEPVLGSLDATAPRPKLEREAEGAASAIEQAMLGKGVVLPAAGSYRLTPSLAWMHAGSGSQRRDAYQLGLGLEAGLPGEMAVSLSAPYIRRDYAEGASKGLGDWTVGLSKEIVRESESGPSWVAHLAYTHNNGRDAFAAIPVGNGFRTVSVSLSAVRRIDPLVLYGQLVYRHGWATSSDYWDGSSYGYGRITPADTYGLGAGVSLAATPDVSLDAGFTLEQQGRTRYLADGSSPRWGDRTTAGYIHLGAGLVLKRNLFLNLTAMAGVTADADDLIVMVELPYRY